MIKLSRKTDVRDRNTSSGQNYRRIFVFLRPRAFASPTDRTFGLPFRHLRTPKAPSGNIPPAHHSPQEPIQESWDDLSRPECPTSTSRSNGPYSHTALRHARYYPADEPMETKGSKPCGICRNRRSLGLVPVPRSTLQLRRLRDRAPTVTTKFRELYLGAGSWHSADLSGGICAPAASGNPAGYVRSDGTDSVVYRGENNHIYELALRGTWPGWPG